MSQAKLMKVNPGEYGAVLILEDLEGKEMSYMYNGNLTVEQLEKLKGQQFSYTSKGTQLNTIHKAWNENGQPTYSKADYDGDDRSSL